MRVTVVTRGDAGRNPKARALAWSLHRVGHQVTTVHAGQVPPGWPARILWIPSRVPVGLGPIGQVARRLQPKGWREADHRRRLANAVSGTDPEIVVPLTEHDLSTAVAGRGTGVVLADPAWERDPSWDMATKAPHDRRLGTSPAGSGLDHHMPGWRPAPPMPSQNRWAGATVVVGYRQTETTPGRYLTAAMERAGIEVIRVGTSLDWDDIPERARAVLIVESPLPEVEITGTRRPVPVLFWVHHGEHHLGPNLRLTERYQADAVLMAHSWHLAHRFQVPVHRFPFGVPTELFPPVRTPFSDRSYDVAMVGVGMAAEAGRYSRRGRMVTDLIERFGRRGCFPGRVSPEELAAIYGDSRFVVNDGGTKHLPITMRVFEAIGGGATLVSEDLPGMDILLGPEGYRVLEDDAAEQISTLLADPHTAERADSTFDHVMRFHTYDRRVDELMAVIDTTTPNEMPRRPVPGHPLAALVDEDVDVDTVLSVTDPTLASHLPDRAVWDHASVATKLASMRFDAVAISQVTEDAAAVVATAQRFVYATAETAHFVTDLVTGTQNRATLHRTSAGLRADLHFAGGYRQKAAAP